jgi:hypothetical protein
VFGLIARICVEHFVAEVKLCWRVCCHDAASNLE